MGIPLHYKMMKKCSRCKKRQSKSNFHTRSGATDGLQYLCKLCKKKDNRVRYKKHEEKIKENTRRWRKKNPDKIKSIRRIYARKKRKLDILCKLAHNIRNRLRSAIKNNQKSGSAINDLGCSIEYFKKCIEKQFRKGMSWNNYGQWHIDHIKPLSKFNLTNRQEFLKACHYTNLQPLWKKDNLRKGRSSE